MQYRPDRPLTVQGDQTVLLEVNHPDYERARDLLVRFAELEKSPEYVHTYRLSPLSLWNAAAAGHSAGELLAGLEEFGKFEVPAHVHTNIGDLMGRYGRLRLLSENGELLLEADDPFLLRGLRQKERIAGLLGEPVGTRRVWLAAGARGRLKQELLKLGHPVDDRAGFRPGEVLRVELRPVTEAGRPLEIRDYQEAAAAAFHQSGGPAGGSGVVVLPCGAGKTVVGLAALTRLGTATLILVTGETAARQWRREILDKTTATEEEIGLYTGKEKTVRPITIATYQILTHRRGKEEEFRHLELFAQRDWGLIIYDEVHLLPAPVFRLTAELQAHRRLGLTATLVREDGRADEVFSLIGPKRYDLPWKKLEEQGWIAPAVATEIRVPLGSRAEAYFLAETRDQASVAAQNPGKVEWVKRLLAEHPGEPTLVIGQYLEQLEEIAREIGAPLLTGKVPQRQREDLYRAFREGRLPCLVVSKVANFSIDLPEASVAIQVSGAFGSRQEEAQRLGRILRPKSDGRTAHFYTLVSHGTVEQDFALRRQLFLTEQGYRYRLLGPEEQS